jgi:chloride channel protein, CIC family
MAISRRISRLSIVEQQMIDEGYVEGHDSADPLSRVRVSEVMTRSPLAVRDSDQLAIAVITIGSIRHRMYPVVDGEGRLVGIITRKTVDKAYEKARGVLVHEVMEPPALIAVADEELLEIVRRMQMGGIDRCPVVEADGTSRLVGFLSPSDILRARIAHARVSEDEVDFELFET